MEGSGKSSTATATVSAIAQNALSGNNVLAQSVLAVYKGADYIRHGEPVNLKHSPIYVQPDFDIAPNPTSNVVNINIIKPVSENRNLLVYRPDGQLVLNVIVSANSRRLTLDTQQLHSGIYFCKLTNSNSTAKLVIVK